MKMRRWFFAAVAVVAAVALAGCPNGNNGNDNGNNGNGADTPLNIDLVEGLQDAGGPTLLRRGNYILITDRANSWYAIDTQFNELTGGDAIVATATYTLTITGRMLGAGTVRMEYPLAAEPWNMLIDSEAVAAGGDFTLVAEDVPGSHINGASGIVPGIHASVGASANIRVTGPANIDILITGISLERTGRDPLVIVPLAD